MKQSSIDIYILGLPEVAREKVKALRQLLMDLIPDSTEVISYGIPTINVKGKHVIHYAGYKNHIGLYPGSKAIEYFSEDLKGYKTSKGTIQIPLDDPLPEQLITRITQYLLAQRNENS